MCTHHHKKTYINGLSKICIITDYAKDKQLTIPIDNKGKCIFHSTDITWKRANNCGEKFWEVLQLMAADETIENIDCREFILTGLAYGEDQGYQEGEVPLKEENIIALTKVHLKKPLRMQGAKFCDDVLIQDIICEESADFDEVVFKGVVTIGRCEFKGMVSFIGGSRFEHNLIVEDCLFAESFDFHNVVAMQQIMFTNVMFGAEVMFVGFTQIAANLICSFSEVTFNEYTSFSESGFNSTLGFDHCRFLGETHFENTAFRKRFQVLDPVIGDKVFFIANKPGVKLFENAVDFEVSLDSFEDMGQLIFEQVNLFNFDATFKSQLKELELAHKIELRAGCILYRRAIERRFAYVEFNMVILEDISRAIAGYFDSLLQRSLQIDIRRDIEKKAIVLLFHTEENISLTELEQLIYQTKESILSLLSEPNDWLAKTKDKAMYTDHFLKFKSIWERYGLALSNGLLEAPLLEMMMTEKGEVTNEKLKELFGITVNVYIKNWMKDNQITAKGDIQIGDVNNTFFNKNKDDKNERVQE